MSADKLLAQLRAAGLKVVEYPGWKTKGKSWVKGKPVGVMHHHTAPPIPYPVANLAGSDKKRIKCNINVKQDGTVILVAYKACNYSSGGGMKQVLAEVMAGKPPTKNAKARGWSPTGSDDNMDGNPYYFNFENDHKGDGSVIPKAQLDAIAKATAVVNKHFGLKYVNVLSHAEHTARKSDPFWNKNPRCIEEIRTMVKAVEAGVVPPPTPTPSPTPKPQEKENAMYPIKRGETSEDVKNIQAKMKQMGVDAGNDGLADQDFLNKFFAIVGSPAGGSFISGAEGAIFDSKYVAYLSVSFAEGDKRWAPLKGYTDHVKDAKTTTPHS